MTFFGLPGTKQGHMPVVFNGLIEDFDPEAIQRSWRERDSDPPNDYLDGQQVA